MFSIVHPRLHVRPRGPYSRAVVVAAGVVVNFLLAWFCIFGSVTSGGIVQPHYNPGLLVNQVKGAWARVRVGRIDLYGGVGRDRLAVFRFV